MKVVASRAGSVVQTLDSAIQRISGRESKCAMIYLVDLDFPKSSWLVTRF